MQQFQITFSSLRFMSLTRKEDFPMAEYRRSEAREWAKAKMRGVANVIIPTFTQGIYRD
jgi:hypothetical protein